MTGPVPPFRWGLVDNDRDREAVYRLRYDVLVMEFRQAAAVDHPGGRLVDAFDPFSLQAAVWRGHDVVAAARLVMHSPRGFPMERRRPLRLSLPTEEVGEISHVVVSPLCRRRWEDGFYGVESYLRQSEGGVLPEKEGPPPVGRARRKPEILLGLFRTLYWASRERGLREWLMSSDRKLTFLLARFGLVWHQMSRAQAGPSGFHIPHRLSFEDLADSLRRLNPPLYHEFTRGSVALSRGR